MRVELGGRRLGNKNEMDVDLSGYKTSWHDISFAFRSPMSVGTLVPCFIWPLANGEELRISSNEMVRTHPTLNPVYGTYKMQIDYFLTGNRLYNRFMHNNKKGIGLNMKQVVNPIIHCSPNMPDLTQPNLNQQQVNSSSLLAYLEQRGFGHASDGSTGRIHQDIAALPHLMYWDIVANYYANLQEENLQYIGAPININSTISRVTKNERSRIIDITSDVLDRQAGSVADIVCYESSYIGITGTFLNQDNITVFASSRTTGGGQTPTSRMTIRQWVEQLNAGPDIQTPASVYISGSGNFLQIIMPTLSFSPGTIEATGFLALGAETGGSCIMMTDVSTEATDISIKTCPVANIDTMREYILSSGSLGVALPIYREEDDISIGNIAPYNENFLTLSDNIHMNCWMPLNGLALKTYDSDINNNFLRTEWIDGTGGVNEITRITTAVLSTDGLYMDTLNMMEKLYELMNRVVVMNGTARAWQIAVWAHGARDEYETPQLCGGKNINIQFNEVISSAESGDEPLGSLGGRGTIAGSKGGKTYIRAQEPSYAMAIVSITPRVDYSQGNAWWRDIKTWDDTHKPGLDGIGFQERMTDHIAAFDKTIDINTGLATRYSMGKQPAWITYQTNVNKTFSNFASDNDESQVVNNRRYYADENGRIANLTTYIDPRDWNYQFATTERSSQHFWVQIGFDIAFKFVGSANQIPNL